MQVAEGYRLFIAVLAASLAVSAGCRSQRSDPPAEPPRFEDRPPAFVELGDLPVTVDGEPIRLGDATLRYHRRTVDQFNDSATPNHDGINRPNREFLACDADRWSIGLQTFTVDFIADGIAQHDPALLERGAIGVDWGVSLPLGRNGVHTLHRECDDATVEDYGGTHHSTQWLVELGRAVHLLRSLEDGGYEDRIDRYIKRLEELAERLMTPGVFAHWEKRWLVDDEGNIYTHKAHMMAAGLQLAASLTDDLEKAAEWVARAAAIARHGIAVQRDDGVNPEKGGYDVSYQMYGTWLAQLYLSVLSQDSVVRPDVESMIDRAIAWMVGRTDPQTGQVDIGASTRTCPRREFDREFDSAHTVRVLLYQVMLNPDQRELTDLAVVVDRGAKRYGNPCPRG